MNKPIPMWLREDAAVIRSVGFNAEAVVCEQAADEIEQLRRVIAKYLDEDVEAFVRENDPSDMSVKCPEPTPDQQEHLQKVMNADKGHDLDTVIGGGYCACTGGFISSGGPHGSPHCTSCGKPTHPLAPAEGESK